MGVDGIWQSQQPTLRPTRAADWTPFSDWPSLRPIHTKRAIEKTRSSRCPSRPASPLASPAKGRRHGSPRRQISKTLPLPALPRFLLRRDNQSRCSPELRCGSQGRVGGVAPGAAANGPDRDGRHELDSRTGTDDLPRLPDDERRTCLHGILREFGAPGKAHLQPEGGLPVHGSGQSVQELRGTTQRPSQVRRLHDQVRGTALHAAGAEGSCGGHGVHRCQDCTARAIDVRAKVRG